MYIMRYIQKAIAIHSDSLHVFNILFINYMLLVYLFFKEFCKSSELQLQQPAEKTNSKEQITNPRKRIPNPRERIAQFNMMISFSFFLLKILISLQDFGNSKMPFAGRPLNSYHVKHIFIGLDTNQSSIIIHNYMYMQVTNKKISTPFPFLPSPEQTLKIIASKWAEQAHVIIYCTCINLLQFHTHADLGIVQLQFINLQYIKVQFIVFDIQSTYQGLL